MDIIFYQKYYRTKQFSKLSVVKKLHKWGKMHIVYNLYAPLPLSRPD